jgi:sugar O-acyltransferase (sialic acid O-acetyltransferase NeuD family)
MNPMKSLNPESMKANHELIKGMILWGAKGQAKVLRECMNHHGIKVIALFDNEKNLKSPFPDIPIYHGKKEFEQWVDINAIKKPIGFLVAIGGDKGQDRIEIQDYLESHGLIPMIARHPRAFIAESAQIGSGSQILANSAVCVEVIIGRGCIINTGAIVDHESRIDEGVHICPGAHLAGCTEIGRFSTVGTGAVILPRVKLGEGVTVGAGAVVTEDIPPRTVVMGNPAKPFRGDNQ